MSASTVRAGGLLTVGGSGFTPGEQVEIWLNSTPRLLATATASEEGDINATVRIPGDIEAGAHTVRLVGKTSGVTASTTITVQGATATTTSRSAAAPTRSSSAAGTKLSYTGFASGPIVLGGLVLIGLGTTALLVSRRRYRPDHR